MISLNMWRHHRGMCEDGGQDPIRLLRSGAEASLLGILPRNRAGGENRRHGR
jgi:hypothetical protein